MVTGSPRRPVERWHGCCWPVALQLSYGEGVGGGSGVTGVCEIKAHPPAQLLFLNSKQTGGLDSLFPGLVLHIITLLFFFIVILDGISLCTGNWLDTDDAVWVGLKSAGVPLPWPPKRQACRYNHAQPSFNFNICPLKKKKTKQHKRV